MEQVDTKLLDRLRKVLALTTSPNEGEAAAATAKLQEVRTGKQVTILSAQRLRGEVAAGMMEAVIDAAKEVR